ncbi:MAG: ATP-binding protein [Lachnospiraceae bacterium]|nr:ATP-binding protein [Lachnospiraceae bacterium]
MGSIHLRKNRIIMIVGGIAFLFLLVVIFLQFQFNTVERTSQRNETFAIEETKSSASQISREFQSAKDQIEAYAYMMTEDGSKREVNADFLAHLEEESEFDYVRFTTEDGYNLTSLGEMSDARDRDYYIKGMRGESGISVVMDSRISGETMLCFFAPVIYERKPYGVLRGVFSADSYLIKLLSSTFFGESVSGYICTRDGSIIATTDPYFPEGNLGEYLEKENYIDAATRETFMHHIEKGSAGSFHMATRFNTDNICVQPILDGTLSLIKVFPKSVTQNIASESNHYNFVLLIILFVIVLGYFVFASLSSRVLRKKILQENTQMKYLIKGTEDFVDKAVLVDLEKGEYEYLNQCLPLSASLSKKGNYLDFYHLILSTIIEKKDRDYMAEMIAPDKLSKLMMEHMDKNFTSVYEVNRNGEKSWECIYIICIETKYKAPTKALFLRSDFTEVQQEKIKSEQMVSQAIADASKANEAKSSFLANMSHEIRTPINAVLGMNAMILREKNLDNIKAHAKDIQSAGRSLLAIINDILDFSKIESGKMELVLVSYDLESLLHDCYNIVYPRMMEKELSFIVDVDPKMPTTLYGDEIRIRQMIINLLTNAAKYTETGSVHLKFGYRTVASDTIKMIVEVRDTGIGITKENLRKLFRSFQRVDETRNRTIEGTGLGLSITKSFVEMMEGNITVESEYGKGSTFTIEIPQKTIDKTPIGEWDAEAQIVEEEQVYIEPFHAPDAKVLVVDDTEMNLRVFKGLVKDLQIQVETAKSGAEALELLEKNTYHLVFMDYRMPVMNGVETLHAFRKRKSAFNKETPFIVLTANAMSGAREEYQGEGFDDYLSKPVKEEILYGLLEEYLPRELLVYAKDYLKEEKVLSTGDSHSEEKPVKEIKVEESTQAKEVPQEPSEFKEEEGLAYCGDDMDLYKEMIALYVEDAPLVEEELTGYLEGEDMTNYNIRVHALKSTSRTLGILGIGDDAFFLEKQSEAGNIAVVREKHGALMTAVKDMAAYLAKRYDL